MADLPPEKPLNMMQLNHCITAATNSYVNVSPLMLKTLLAVEGGQIGTIRENTDRSLDLGPMQINTVHLPDVRRVHGFSARDLVYDACKNIKVGAWLLSDHIKKAKGSYWLAMGNYHSKTADKRAIYLRKIAKAYAGLLTGIQSGKEAEAIGRTVNWGKGNGVDARVPSLDLLEAMLDGRVPLDTTEFPMQRKAPLKKTIPQRKVVEIDTQRKSLRFVEDE